MLWVILLQIWALYDQEMNQSSARIQLSVMAHCLAELILKQISKNWTNLSYYFGWFIILNVMSDLAANLRTLRSRNESEQCTHPTLRHGTLFGSADSETNFEKLDKLVLLLWMIYYSKCYEWSCCKFWHFTMKKWTGAVSGRIHARTWTAAGYQRRTGTLGSLVS